MTDHDLARLNAAAARLNVVRDRIVAFYRARFPHDPLVVGLAADELALAELKRAIMAKTRVGDYEEARAER